MSVQLSLSERWIAACRCGRMEVVREMYATEELDDSCWRAGWYSACQSSQYEVVRWLSAQRDVPLWTHHMAWRLECARGHLEPVEWLWRTTERVGYGPAGDYLGWCAACMNGHLGVAQWIWTHGEAQIDERSQQVWEKVCERGHLGVACWMLTIGVPARYSSELWVKTCREGHLSVARWLWSESPVTDPDSLGLVWMRAYHNHHLALMEWLLEVGAVEETLVQEMISERGEIGDLLRDWASRRRVKSARSAEVTA